MQTLSHDTADWVTVSFDRSSRHWLLRCSRCGAQGSFGSGNGILAQAVRDAHRDYCEG